MCAGEQVCDQNQCIPRPDGELPPIDATPLIDATPPCVWSSPAIVPNVNTSMPDAMATEGPEGLTLLLTRTVSVSLGDSDIYRATRTDADLPFTAPAPLTAINSANVFDDDPELSTSGLELFFRRSVAEDPMSGVWTSTRATVASNFSAPQTLGVDGYSPSISGDGLTLYYVATTTPGMVRSISRPSIGGLWGPPVDVLATEYRGLDVSQDELTLLLSDGPVGFASAPVVIVERENKTAPFGAPQVLDAFSVAGDTNQTKSASWNRGDRVIYLQLRLPTGQGGPDIYVSSCE